MRTLPASISISQATAASLQQPSATGATNNPVAATGGGATLSLPAGQALTVQQLHQAAAQAAAAAKQQQAVTPSPGKGAAAAGTGVSLQQTLVTPAQQQDVGGVPGQHSVVTRVQRPSAAATATLTHAQLQQLQQQQHKLQQQQGTAGGSAANSQGPSSSS